MRTVLRRINEKIRDAIRKVEYQMTMHANEEMADDNLDIHDVENAILTGKIIEQQKEEPDQIKYLIIGKAIDDVTRVAVLGKFKETGVFLIITVYKI